MLHYTVKLTLTVHFTEDYPDTLPDLSLEAIEGTLNDDELHCLMRDMRTVARTFLVPNCIDSDLNQGEENIGMAMTFTLVSDLREKLSSLVCSRTEQRMKEEMEKQRTALEVFECTETGLGDL